MPIVWSVRGQGVFESAPFQADRGDHENFLTHFTWPIDEKEGELLDWFTMPVINDRFPEFARASRWTPSPLEPVYRLSSILKSPVADER
ncbi:hypothetical protein [Nocardiopsis deserti]|uniref:hypothetical protein n=1 Tax=Nocardiopsis deserti TaxID=2605988 RepID=UPI00123ACB00|nr:hypothetical protein [Nocardiopsis deserti]